MLVSIHIPSDALHRLLDDSLNFAPEYGTGLSSHLPMALAALDAMGAGADRLDAFFAAYGRRLAPGSPRIGAGEIDDWRALRGNLAAHPTLAHAFATALARDGRDAVLRAALPDLVTGVGAAAFHGLIRTAHAVESGHNGELAAALAYWAARWMPLAAPEVAGAAIGDAAAWLDAIDACRASEDVAWAPRDDLISDRMLDASRTRAYRGLAGRSGIEDDPGAWFKALALAAAARYAATRNFTVLHLCTAARAARVLVPWLPADGAAMRPLAHAVAAASLAADTAGVPARSPGSAGLGWSAVIAHACNSDDDHVIKLVHAMAVQSAADPDGRWLAAANVALVEA